MILYAENLTGSTKNPLDLINELGKLVGYKANVQKLMAFLYINNELSERETKKTIPALAGVAQWIELLPENQRVGSLIPSQGTCLGCGPGPQ